MSKEERVVRAAVDDGFPAGMPDEEWLPVVGRNGWIVISSDTKIKRPLQRDLWFLYGVRGFLFTENRLRGETRAIILRAAFPQMRVLVRETEPPFLGCITVEGYAKIELDLADHKQVRRNEKKAEKRKTKTKGKASRRAHASKSAKRKTAIAAR